MTVEVVAVISDIHWPHTHLKTWRAFRAWHRYVRPSRTIVLGDFFDLPMVSNHPPEPEQGIELLPPIKSGCRQLAELAEESGRIDFVEGNHEGRLFKKLVQPLAYQLRGLEHLISLEGLCRAHGLPESVHWHVENPPAPTLRVCQFVLRHGHHQSGRYGGGVAPARSLLLKEAHQDWSALVGHYHRPQIHVQGDRVYAVNPHMEADVKYTGGIDGWCRGWSVLEVDTERSCAHLKQFLSNDGRFVCDGQVYDGSQEGGSVGAMAAPGAAAPPVQQQSIHGPGDESGLEKVGQHVQVPLLGAGPVVAKQHPGVHPPVPKQPAPQSSQGFHVRSWEAGGRRHLRFVLPNEHGRWVPMNTAQVARWAGHDSVHGANLVRTRLKGWERATGASVDEITFEEFQELVTRPAG